MLECSLVNLLKMLINAEIKMYIYLLKVDGGMNGKVKFK